MARRLSSMHQVAPRDALDRSAFILAFLIGVGGGIILKSLSTHSMLAALFSATVLVVYALAAWLGGRIRLEPEVVGDNCYYLGFLFTLASLAHTLYLLSDDGSGAGQISSVISGFGVALSSTIVGVFLRVLLMQMRVDFVAKEREIKADVNKSYTELRKQMAGSIQQMKMFTTQSIQHASERDEQLRASTEAFVKDHTQAVLTASEALTKSIETSIQDSVVNAMNEIQTALTSSSEASKTALDELIVDIKRMQNDLSILHADSLQQRSQQDLQVKNKTDEIETHLQAQAMVLVKFSDDLGETLNKMNTEIPQPFHTIENRLSVLATALETETQKHLHQITAFTEATQSATQKFETQINPALDTFHGNLERLSKTPITELITPSTAPTEPPVTRNRWFK